MSQVWKKKPERQYIDWVGRTGFQLTEEKPEIPGLPTDEDLNKALLAAGFTTCEGKPYRPLYLVKS